MDVNMMHGSMDFESPPSRHFVIEFPGSDIQREGYLKKLKTNKKKYFVLRSTSSSGPARLEYYDSEKKLKAGQQPKRSIKLHTCFNINKKNDPRQRFAIALYTKDECFSVVADGAVEQELWLNLLLKLQFEYITPGELPRPHYDHVWQVSVKPKGLGISRAICGDYRLCLSETEICMVKRSYDKPEFTFQLSNVRRCGNTENFFFMEVGRHAPTGPGDFYMQLEDNFSAANIHEEMLIYMRKNSSGESFRQRSSTGSSTMRSPHEGGDSETDLTSVRQRTHSEGKKHGSSPRKLNQRPQSVANMPSYTKSGSDLVNSGFYANIPSTFAMPRDRSDSASSRASSHKSLPSEAYGSSPEPVSYRSMTPETVPSITEESLSSYMDMSPSQTSATLMENSQYLEMSPGQQNTKHSPNANKKPRSSNLPITQNNPQPDTVIYDRSYMSMSPGQHVTQSSVSSYMAMSPGQYSVPTTTVPSHSAVVSPSQHSAPYSPPSQRASRPETPPSQRVSRPGSSCSHDSSINSSEGYMEMNPAEQSKSSERVNAIPEQAGYIDMTVGSSSSTSSKDGSPKLSCTAPIPIRSTKQQGYLEITPSSQPLPPVKEGGSGEGYLPMTPQFNSHPLPDSTLRPNKVISYLSDDSMSGEFPKRAYSVGSRPPRKIIPHLHHHPIAKPNMSNNARSSSAPHLIEKKLRGMIPYTAMDSSLSCSPSQSIKSSVSDSDSFVEMECMRPRTSSDSFGCRPRSSSFGKVFGQGHRPRSSSYGTSARGKLGSYESVRLTSKELHLKLSNESLNQMSGASSSESLKKAEMQAKIKQKSEYVDMRLDKTETPGYIDMTVNPKNVGNKSCSSLSSSPAVAGLTSPVRSETTLSPSIKVIMPSGKTQNPVGFSTPSNSSNTSLSSIPPQSALFSPIDFLSSGSRSPSVKGRSPASSGRESEEETYLPFQPASSNIHKGDKKYEQKKDKKSWHAKSKHKDKKHADEKNKKHSDDKDKKHSDDKDKKHSDDKDKKHPDDKDKKHSDDKDKKQSDKSTDNVLGINIQEMKNDRDSMYMDFEPGMVNLSNQQEDTSIKFSLGPDYSQSVSGSDAGRDLSQNQFVDSSPYMEYQPEVPVSKIDSGEKLSTVSDDSAYLEYEPGSVTNNQLSDADVGKTVLQNTPPIPPRKFEALNLKGGFQYESDSPSIENTKDTGSVSQVEMDPYMDFDPENAVEKPSEVKTPTRVRSFITDTSMEDELAKDESSNKSGNIKTSVDENVNRSKVNEDVLNEKGVQIKKKSVIKPAKCSIPENDEYVGLDYGSKSSEHLLLGGINTGAQTLTHNKLLESKPNIIDEKLKNDRLKIDISDDKKMEVTFKGSVSSLEELKIDENTISVDIKEAKNRKLSTSAKISTPQELTKQSSLPCMNLPAEVLDMQMKEKERTCSMIDSSRHSCSDLTSYEPMNFPSDTIKSSEMSSSQQELGTPGLNYASLDLGSRENMDVSDLKLQPVKSRHASSAEDSGPLPPNSYAQIDFKMSENLKNSGKQDAKSVLD